MNSTPKVIEHVVKNDICIGCGVCSSFCPHRSISMQLNDNGFWNPVQNGVCCNDGSCISVCPFNPFATSAQSEDALADSFLTTANQFKRKIGKYRKLYIGYSDPFRISSASGGIATYVLSRLLEQKIVDHVFTVTASKEVPSKDYFEYSVVSNQEQLRAASSTKYYPVTMDKVFNQIERTEGRIAIVGVGCFVKAIRLSQQKQPALKNKIPFVVGIICGGLKSSFYTEYLAGQVGIQPRDIVAPNYRVKSLNSRSDDYSFSAIDAATKERRAVQMKTLGDMWGSGLFKNSACDFCDDVTTELADISVGDAWLKPFCFDGRGTNVVIVRSQSAENILVEGEKTSSVSINTLSLEDFLQSQRGSFHHRHDALQYRRRRAIQAGRRIPQKRYDTYIPIDFRLVQRCREETRKNSLTLWKKTKKRVRIFDMLMLPFTLKLKVATKLYHASRHFRDSFGSDIKENVKR